jgi:hypothetical protein
MSLRHILDQHTLSLLSQAIMAYHNCFMMEQSPPRLILVLYNNVPLLHSTKNKISYFSHLHLP